MPAARIGGGRRRKAIKILTFGTSQINWERAFLATLNFKQGHSQLACTKYITFIQVYRHTVLQTLDSTVQCECGDYCTVDTRQYKQCECGDYCSQVKVNFVHFTQARTTRMFVNKLANKSESQGLYLNAYEINIF